MTAEIPKNIDQNPAWAWKTIDMLKARKFIEIYKRVFQIDETNGKAETHALISIMNGMNALAGARHATRVDPSLETTKSGEEVLKATFYKSGGEEDLVILIGRPNHSRGKIDK